MTSEIMDGIPSISKTRTVENQISKIRDFYPFVPRSWTTFTRVLDRKAGRDERREEVLEGRNEGEGYVKRQVIDAQREAKFLNLKVNGGI